MHLYSDHQALTFLFTCKLRNSRLSRWALLLQEYNLQISHCTGKDNHIDTLSRHPVGRDDVPIINAPAIFNITVPPDLPDDIKKMLVNISDDQINDKRLSKIFIAITTSYK